MTACSVPVSYTHLDVYKRQGLALSSATFLIVAFLQYRLEEGTSMSIAWQLIPYCVLTISCLLYTSRCV